MAAKSSGKAAMSRSPFAFVWIARARSRKPRISTISAATFCGIGANRRGRSVAFVCRLVVFGRCPFLGRLLDRIEIADGVDVDGLLSLKTINNARQGFADGVAGRSKDFAQAHGDQGIGLAAQIDGFGALEEFRHFFIKLNFGRMGVEPIGCCNSPCVADMPRFLNVAAQGSPTDGLQAFSKNYEIGGGRSSAAIERSKARLIAEHLVVDHRNEAKQLHNVVLKRRGRQQHLERFLKAFLQPLRPLRGPLLVHVPESVRFVEHDNVPMEGNQIIGLCSSKLVGSNKNPPVRLERSPHCPPSDALGNCGLP